LAGCWLLSAWSRCCWAWPAPVRPPWRMGAGTVTSAATVTVPTSTGGVSSGPPSSWGPASPEVPPTTPIPTARTTTATPRRRWWSRRRLRHTSSGPQRRTGTTARIRPAASPRWGSARAGGSRSGRDPSNPRASTATGGRRGSGVLQEHSPVGLGGGQLPATALLASPLGDHLGRIPLAHLAVVGAQRGHLHVEELRDVDERIRSLGPVDVDLAHLVWLEPFIQQLGKEQPRPPRRKHHGGRQGGRR